MQAFCPDRAPASVGADGARPSSFVAGDAPIFARSFSFFGVERPFSLLSRPHFSDLGEWQSFFLDKMDDWLDFSCLSISWGIF